MKLLECFCKRCGGIIPIFIADIQHLLIGTFKIISGKRQLTETNIPGKTDTIHIREYLLKKRIGTARHMSDLILIYRFFSPLKVIFCVINNVLKLFVPFHMPALIFLTDNYHNMKAVTFPLIFGSGRIGKMALSHHPTANVISADAAIFPSTVAFAVPTPIGPFCLMISSSSVSTSPGTTFFLNFALSIPPK